MTVILDVVKNALVVLTELVLWLVLNKLRQCTIRTLEKSARD